MKIFKFLALMLVMLIGISIFTSCSKDDDNDKNLNGISAQLIGTWKQSNDWGYEILTFEKDGTGTLIDYDYEDGKEVERFTWSVNDNLLTMHFGDEYESYQVISVNSICLIIKYYDKYDDDREEERWYKQ